MQAQPRPQTLPEAPTTAGAAAGGIRPGPWFNSAAVLQPLTAAQRKEIGGMLPGLMVHTSCWLLLGASPAQPHRLWRQAELLLVVAVMLLEIVLIWLLPTLSGPLLCAPRRVLGRLILLSLPSFRRTTVGMGRMLERPPLSGPLGALVDLARLILGTNVLTAFSQGAYASLPPVGQLLLQCTLTKLLWRPAEVCQSPVREEQQCDGLNWSSIGPSLILGLSASLLFITAAWQSTRAFRFQAVRFDLLPTPMPQMLQAPLSQKRLADVATGLETAALCLMSPMRADSQTLYLLMAQRADPERVCVAVVSFSQLAIGLLPVVLAAHGWRPGAEGQAQQGSGWRRAWRRSNLVLQQWARAWPGTGAFMLRAWLLCAVLWLGCRLSAGLI